jgi:hypothetical protein
VDISDPCPHQRKEREPVYVRSLITGVIITIIIKNSLYLVNVDALVRSLKTPYSVIPVKTGTQVFQLVPCSLDFRLRGNDDF